MMLHLSNSLQVSSCLCIALRTPVIGASNHHASNQYISSKPNLIAGLSDLQKPALSLLAQEQRSNLLSNNVESLSTEFNGFNPKEWDGWPNGDFTLDVTHAQARATNDFEAHWAGTNSGASLGRGYSSNASHWERGLYKRRGCLGITKCDNDECRITKQPPTRIAQLRKQLQERCECGSQLIHHPCDAYSITRTWKDGVHYEHHGLHHHIPPHVLHLTPNEKAEFEQVIHNNPQAGALALLVGAPGRRSVSQIATPLYNIDRIRTEQRKARQSLRVLTGDFAQNVEEWTKHHTDYVRHYDDTDGIETLSLQSKYMASLPLDDLTEVKDPAESTLTVSTKGHVTDAAHGFWHDSRSILIVSSVYVNSIHCWSPVLFTYSNGQSTDHYYRHFRVLIQSIAEDADRCRLPINVAYFAGVSCFFF